MHYQHICGYAMEKSMEIWYYDAGVFKKMFNLENSMEIWYYRYLCIFLITIKF